MLHIGKLFFVLHQRIRDRAIWQNINMPPKVRIDKIIRLYNLKFILDI